MGTNMARWKAHPPLARQLRSGDSGIISGQGRWFYLTQEPARWMPLHPQVHTNYYVVMW